MNRGEHSFDSMWFLVIAFLRTLSVEAFSYFVKDGAGMENMSFAGLIIFTS